MIYLEVQDLLGGDRSQAAIIAAASKLMGSLNAVLDKADLRLVGVIAAPSSTLELIYEPDGSVRPA